MQRIANPSSPVRLRVAPPNSIQRTAPQPWFAGLCCFRVSSTVHPTRRPDGEIGRHMGLKIPRFLKRGMPVRSRLRAPQHDKGARHVPLQRSIRNPCARRRAAALRRDLRADPGSAQAPVDLRRRQVAGRRRGQRLRGRARHPLRAEGAHAADLLDRGRRRGFPPRARRDVHGASTNSPSRAPPSRSPSTTPTTTRKRATPTRSRATTS